MVFYFDSTDHSGCPVLNSLDALHLMYCDASQQRIAVLKVEQYKCCHYALIVQEHYGVCEWNLEQINNKVKLSENVQKTIPTAY